MKVQVVEALDAPIERAWPVFSDFGALSDMMKGVSVDIQGSGIGAVRTVVNPDGSKIQERLEALDEATYSFAYAVINDDAPVPFSGYLATVTLRPLDSQRCEVDWSSVFEPEGISEVDVRAIIEGAYRSAICHLMAKV